MRSVFTLVSMCMLAACAAPGSEYGQGQSYAGDRVTTGSNIPHRGTAAVADPTALDNQLNRAAGSSSVR